MSHSKGIILFLLFISMSVYGATDPGEKNKGSSKVDTEATNPPEAKNPALPGITSSMGKRSERKKAYEEMLAKKKEARKKEPPEMAELRQAFDHYKKAVIDRNGKNIALMLTDESIAYYEKQREHALYSDLDALFDLPPVDQMHVLVFRLTQSAEELKKMQVDELIAMATSQKLISAEINDRSDSGKLTISKDAAVLQQTQGSFEVNKLHWKRVNGKWRLDGMQLLEKMDKDLENLMDNQRANLEKNATLTTKIEIVHLLVELSTGEKLQKNHFEPLVKSKEGDLNG